MQILKTLKPIRMNGKIIEPGQIVKVSANGTLTNRGYARNLTQEEIRTVLNDYVQQAKRLFLEEPNKKTIVQTKAAAQGNCYDP